MLGRLALRSASITLPVIRPLQNLVLGRGEGSLPTNPRFQVVSWSCVALHQVRQGPNLPLFLPLQWAADLCNFSAVKIPSKEAVDKERHGNSDELSGRRFADILETRKLGGKVASGLAFQQGMKYSTRVGGDPDTHEDFLPTNKSSSISVQDVVQQEVQENPVIIYMKGLPDAPRCGFSALAVKVLQQYGVSISARDILGDPKLKEGVKAYTNWPTFPQIFIKGEFVGGSDIILNMHQKGELKDLLADIAQDRNQGGA